MFRSTGILQYSPKAKSIPSKKWWLVIECCDDLARYYRSLFNHVNRAWYQLHAPAWGSHISVVCDEIPASENLQFWEAHDGEEVEFFYEPILYTAALEVTGNEPRVIPLEPGYNNGQYVWLDVRCERAIELRRELGLSPEPFYPLHLTIGIDLTFTSRNAKFRSCS
jgi:hypothetical protein